jgi:hypothetical protein
MTWVETGRGFDALPFERSFLQDKGTIPPQGTHRLFHTNNGINVDGYGCRTVVYLGMHYWRQRPLRAGSPEPERRGSLGRSRAGSRTPMKPYKLSRCKVSPRAGGVRSPRRTPSTLRLVGVENEYERFGRPVRTFPSRYSPAVARYEHRTIAHFGLADCGGRWRWNCHPLHQSMPLCESLAFVVVFDLDNTGLDRPVSQRAGALRGDLSISGIESGDANRFCHGEGVKWPIRRRIACAAAAGRIRSERQKLRACIRSTFSTWGGYGLL